MDRGVGDWCCGDCWWHCGQWVECCFFGCFGVCDRGEC